MSVLSASLIQEESTRAVPGSLPIPHEEDELVINGLALHHLISPLSESSPPEPTVIKEKTHRIDKLSNLAHSAKIAGVAEIIATLISALLFGTNPLLASFGVGLLLPSFFLHPPEEEFDYGNIRPGDIITRQNTSKIIVVGQRGMGLGKHASSTHIAIVRSVSKDRIELFEAVYRKENGRQLDGVRTNRHNFASFKKWVNKGIRIIRSEDPALQAQLQKTTEEMAKNYEGPDVASGAFKATYCFKRLLTSPILSSKSSEGERRRTLCSLKAKALMNGNNQPSQQAICSEVVAEVVRVAQLTLAISTHRVHEDPTTADLKKLEKDGFLLNAGQTIIPGTLEARLIRKHKFQHATISQSNLVPF